MLTFLNLPQKKFMTVCICNYIAAYQDCLQFFSTAYTFSKLCLFFSKLYIQIQELHTQNAKRLTCLTKLSTALKISQTRLKSKHLSYIANTFAIISYFWIYHTHSYSKPKAILSWAPMYISVQVWMLLAQRCWKNHSNHESKIETKLVFFTVSICGCVLHSTKEKKYINHV